MNARMIALPADIFQLVVDNLVGQPYRDVAKLIAVVQEHARGVDIAPPEPEAAKDDAPTE